MKIHLLFGTPCRQFMGGDDQSHWSQQQLAPQQHWLFHKPEGLGHVPPTSSGPTRSVLLSKMMDLSVNGLKWGPYFPGILENFNSSFSEDRILGFPNFSIKKAQQFLYVPFLDSR